MFEDILGDVKKTERQRRPVRDSINIVNVDQEAQRRDVWHTGQNDSWDTEVGDEWDTSG